MNRFFFLLSILLTDSLVLKIRYCSYTNRCRSFFLDSMTLNNREINFVSYSTERNWLAELPKSNWLCVLVDNDRSRNYIDEVISKIISHDVCYVCTIGQNCERNHDLIDEEIVFRDGDIDDHYLPQHNIMTTWHKDLDQGIWFSIFTAYNEDVSINRVVILDMTSGQETERIMGLLDGYKVSG